jgi:DUF971 family protein
MSTNERSNTPKIVRVEIFPNGEVGLSWSDGVEHFVPARVLRLACPCAGCVDEMTGERTLDPAKVHANVEVESWEAVGRYAIAFRFSDGHDTGLYLFELLREIGERHRARE